MIGLAVGFKKCLVLHDKDTEIIDEEVYQRVKTMAKPFWLHVDGKHYKLDTDDQLRLACMITADYHNVTYYTGVKDDGWEEDTLLSEQKAQAFMDEPSDAEESDDIDCFIDYEELHDKK